MGSRTVVTERDVREAHRSGLKSIQLSPDSVVTPLARDTARELGVTLEYVSPTGTPLPGGRSATRAGRSAAKAGTSPTRGGAPATRGGAAATRGEVSPARPAMQMRPGPPDIVAIGSDHGGFDLKKHLIPFIVELGWRTRDVGTDSERSCDYPDFAYAVARLVASGEAAFGIMIDGAGIGSAVACNKVPGARAACAYNEFTAWNSRAHNNANILTLGSRTLGIEVCKSVVRAFLSTDFEGGRHQNRVDKISDIERRFSRP